MRVVAAVPTEITYKIDFIPDGIVTSEEALPCNFLLEGERKFLTLGVASLTGIRLIRGFGNRTQGGD